MKPIDHTAWCEPENQAGIYLVDVLTEFGDPKLVENVGAYLHKFRIRTKALNSLEREPRVFFLQMLLDKTRAEIRKNFTPKSKLVASLLENLVVGVYRKEMLKL